MGLLGLDFLKNPFKPTITPNQGYAQLDPQSSQLIDKDMQLADVPVDQIQTGRGILSRHDTQALVDPNASAMRSQALGGVSDSVQQDALNRRAQKVYGNATRKMQLATDLDAYSTAANRMGRAADKVGRSEMVKQGMEQRRMEYEANRNAVRQGIISSLVSQGAGIAGQMFGGAISPSGGKGMDASGMELTGQIDSSPAFDYNSKSFGKMK